MILFIRSDTEDVLFFFVFSFYTGKLVVVVVMMMCLSLFVMSDLSSCTYFLRGVSPFIHRLEFYRLSSAIRQYGNDIQ